MGETVDRGAEMSHSVPAYTCGPSHALILEVLNAAIEDLTDEQAPCACLAQGRLETLRLLLTHGDKEPPPP